MIWINRVRVFLLVIFMSDLFSDESMEISNNLKKGVRDNKLANKFKLPES